MNKKGISLITLAITILVMAILTTVIVMTTNNSGIIKNSKNTVNATNLSQVQELAQIAWINAQIDGKESQAELDEAVKSTLTANGVDINKYNITVTENGVKVEEKQSDTSSEESTELIIGNIIPEGGVYTANRTVSSAFYTGGTEYTAGQSMPTAPANGDIFEYGDYIYGYNCYTSSGLWFQAPEQNGWAVMVGVGKMENTAFSEIAIEINNIAVVSLQNTFNSCFNMITAPVIPSSINNMNYTFSDCTSLTGEVIINATPSTFEGCFLNTELPIKIVGECKNKADLASTAGYLDGETFASAERDNVTY